MRRRTGSGDRDVNAAVGHEDLCRRLHRSIMPRLLRIRDAVSWCVSAQMRSISAFNRPPDGLPAMIQLLQRQVSCVHSAALSGPCASAISSASRCAASRRPTSSTAAGSFLLLPLPIEVSVSASTSAKAAVAVRVGGVAKPSELKIVIAPLRSPLLLRRSPIISGVPSARCAGSNPVVKAEVVSTRPSLCMLANAGRAG